MIGYIFLHRIVEFGPDIRIHMQFGEIKMGINSLTHSIPIYQNIQTALSHGWSINLKHARDYDKDAYVGIYEVDYEIDEKSQKKEDIMYINAGFYDATYYWFKRTCEFVIVKCLMETLVEGKK